MTNKIKANPGVVETVIDMLSHIEVDGETMEYILRQVGMEDQMLRQLIMKADGKYIFALLKEKINLPL